MMTARDNRAEIMALLEPSIHNYCKWKWPCIEMEDRVSEARIVLLHVLRERRIPEEHIWPVFLRTLHVYMPPLNRREGWHRYQCRQLDARVRLRDGTAGPALLELLPDPQPDVYTLLEDNLDQPIS